MIKIIKKTESGEIEQLKFIDWFIDKMLDKMWMIEFLIDRINRYVIQKTVVVYFGLL